MMKPGMLHALLLDGSGGARALTRQQIDRWQPADGLLWLHLDYTVPETVRWIREAEELDIVSQDFLLSEDTRPRLTVIDNSLLLALRGVNLNPQSDPEDMIGIRIRADESRIITTIRRRLLSVADIVDALERGTGPLHSSDFIIELAGRLISRMGPTLEGLEELIDDLEEQALDSGEAQLRRQLSSVRRDSIMLRRYLAPQREAMYRLYDEKISWFHEMDRHHSREVTDHLLRFIENLDLVRERAAVLHEELTSSLAEQLNSRMYLLSLVTAIFLPLGLFTGLFGVNLGGIPGAENRFAFAVFVFILIGVAAALLLFFRRKRWM